MSVTSLTESFLTSPSMKTLIVFTLNLMWLLLFLTSETPLQVNSFHPSHSHVYTKINMCIFNSIQNYILVLRAVLNTVLYWAMKEWFFQGWQWICLWVSGNYMLPTPWWMMAHKSALSQKLMGQLTFLSKLHWNWICCEVTNSTESLDLLRHYLKYRWMNGSICWEVDTFFYPNVPSVLRYFSDELTNHRAHSVILWKTAHTTASHSKRCKKEHFKRKFCLPHFFKSNQNKQTNLWICSNLQYYLLI